MLVFDMLVFEMLVFEMLVLSEVEIFGLMCRGGPLWLFAGS